MAKRPKPAAARASAEQRSAPWRIHFWRHAEDDAAQVVPGRDFLEPLRGPAPWLVSAAIEAEQRAIAHTMKKIADERIRTRPVNRVRDT